MQVLAESACPDKFIEIPVGGRNHSHIDLVGLVAAHPFEGPFLEESQQLDLCADRQVADLIEKQCSASAISKRPLREATAPVNAPRSWPNSSDSSTPSAKAAQLTLMKGAEARWLSKWMRLAINSLPVPLSLRSARWRR